MERTRRVQLEAQSDGTTAAAVASVVKEVASWNVSLHRWNVSERAGAGGWELAGVVWLDAEPTDDVLRGLWAAYCAGCDHGTR